jgi:hypothetical protein
MTFSQIGKELGWSTTTVGDLLNPSSLREYCPQYIDEAASLVRFPSSRKGRRQSISMNKCEVCGTSANKDELGLYKGQICCRACMYDGPPDPPVNAHEILSIMSNQQK